MLRTIETFRPHRAWKMKYVCIFKFVIWAKMVAKIKKVHIFSMWLEKWLKLVSAIFYQIFIFSPNDSPSKLWKMFFASSKKLFSFSRYSNFCILFPSFPHFPGSKSTNGSMMSWIVLHKFEDLIFGITQTPFYITPSNLVR